MTQEQIAAHRAHLLKLAADYDRRVNVTITDVTPAGYGPCEPSANSYDTRELRHQSTQEQALRRSIAEGETLLRGRMSQEKRAAITDSVNKSKQKMESL